MSGPTLGEGCQKVNCANMATHAICLAVPSQKDAAGAPARTTVLLNILICEDCIEGETAPKFFAAAGDDLRRLVQLQMGLGHVPDFDRATVVGVELGSAQYAELQRMHESQGRLH